MARYLESRPMPQIEPKNDRRQRKDGRRPLLTYMNRELITDLKKAALDEERNAYEIVEDAVAEWLKQRRQTKQS